MEAQLAPEPAAPIVDTCMHLCSPDVVRYPPCGGKICGGYWAGGGPSAAKDASPEHLRRLMMQHGVDRAFNFCNGWYGWDNSLALDLLRGRSDWLACGVLLDPADPASPTELRRLVGEGASGLRIQPPVSGPLDDPRATALWQVAAELGIPVDVNLPQHDYPQVAPRARQFPDLSIIVDHCGWLVGNDPSSLTVDPACELAHFRNVHPKITFCHAASRQQYPYKDTHPLVHQLVAAFGASRCLWGSNFTGASQSEGGHTYAKAFQLFWTELGFTKEQRSWVMGGTADRLYGQAYTGRRNLQSHL
jgi:L-fuconolactonase